MTACHCFCKAAHVEQGICDVDSPPAVVQVNAQGSMLGALTGVTEHYVAMCWPCAMAVEADNPRVVSAVYMERPAPLHGSPA